MANYRHKKHFQLMNAQAAVGFGSPVDVRDFQNIVLELSTASSANLTIKVQASSQLEQPDFTAAASATNVWDYVATFNLNDPSSVITGDTGVVYAGTDAVERLVVNDNNPSWINVEVTARSAGSITVDMFAVTNE